MSNIPNRAAPARGARDGVKKDFQQAKLQKSEGPKSEVDSEAGRGGSAWSHNFLNQKPWHPGSYRNRLHTWEAEQRTIHEEKMKETAVAEMEAEQEMMRTLSYLSADEQQKYRDRQSIQFMYAKPPGLDAVMAKEKEQKIKAEKALVDPAAAATNDAAAAKAAKEEEEAKKRLMDLDKMRADPYADMLKAKMALAQNERFSIKQAEDRSFGGYDAKSANQQMLDDEEDDRDAARALPSSNGIDDFAEDELNMLASLSERDRVKVLKRLQKIKRKQGEEQKLKEAEAILVAAGYDLNACRKASREDDNESRAKKKHKHKHGKDSEKGHHKRKDKDKR